MSDHPLVPAEVKSYMDQHNLEHVLNRSLNRVLKERPLDALGSMAAQIIQVRISRIPSWLGLTSCAAIDERSRFRPLFREGGVVLREYEDHQDRCLYQLRGPLRVSVPPHLLLQLGGRRVPSLRQQGRARRYEEGVRHDQPRDRSYAEGPRPLEPKEDRRHASEVHDGQGSHTRGGQHRGRCKKISFLANSNAGWSKYH